MDCLSTALPPSDLDIRPAAPDPRRFDFWVLCAAQIAALFGMYVSIVGFSFGQRRPAFHYLLLSLLYGPSIAAIAAKLPRKVGLPVLPVFESLRSGTWSIRTDTWRLIAGAAAGIVVSYFVLFYDDIVTAWLGASRPPSNFFVPNVLGLVCAAISEEILFRGSIFAGLAGAVEFLRRHFACGSKSMSIGIANVLQALLFGAGHIAAGRGILNGRPWYVRLPLISQTWSGMILGLVYRKYGIESAILCHASVDFFLVTQWGVK